MNFHLSDAQEELKQAARRFSLDEVLPVAWHHDEKDDIATVDPKRKHEGICAFIVEKEWKGVSVGRPIEHGVRH